MYTWTYTHLLHFAHVHVILYYVIDQSHHLPQNSHSLASNTATQSQLYQRLAFTINTLVYSPPKIMYEAIMALTSLICDALLLLDQHHNKRRLLTLVIPCPHATDTHVQ